MGPDRVPAELIQVLDGGDESREQLVASVPVSNRAPTGSSGAGRTLYGRQSGGAPPGRSEAKVRAEELVRRAEQDVDAERAYVDRPCGAKWTASTHTRAPASCASSTIRARPASSDGVRGEREGDDAGVLGELPLEVVEVEGRILADLDEVHAEIEVARELEPRSDVAVVVEARDEDLVAGRERAGRTRG